MLRIAHNTTVNADSLYYVQTDLCGSRAQSQTGLSYAEMEHSVRSKILGSWERMVDCNRNVIQTSYPVSGKTFPDPWDEQVRWTCEPMPYEYPFGGNGIGWRMSSTNWTQRQNVVDLPFHRGFTGHEHYDRFGIINMNARLYDPVLARFFSPDPQVQSPYSTQGFNRYSYCGNNPVMYVDEDGESISALAIGAIIGAVAGIYTGGVIANDGKGKPWQWDFTLDKTWGYMFAGGLTGAFCGFIGAGVATSGIPFANTLSLFSSSFFNTAFTNAYTDGQTPITFNFGFASYDATNNQWGWLFKNGNELHQNLGYMFGALAVLPDVVTCFWGNGQTVQSNAAPLKDDWWSHSSITHDKENIISVGPVKGDEVDKLASLMKQLKTVVADTDYPSYANDPGVWTVHLTNISRNALDWYRNRIAHWNILFKSCVAHTTASLWLAGVPTLYFFHPYFLNAQLTVRQFGIDLSSFLQTTQY